MAISQLQLGLGPGVLYLHRGWQSLVDQLAATAGVTWRVGEPVNELPDAPAVIVATGKPEAAGRLLGRSFELGPSAEASCLDLGLARRPGSDFVLGGDVPFYFSNHSAVAALAPPTQYYAAAVQYLGVGDEPDSAALQAFSGFAQVTDDDILCRRSLHRMVTVSAIPTATRGGLAGRPGTTDTGHHNVFIAGDWVGPVGHLADASLASAEAAAHAALAVLGRSLVR